MMMLTMILVLSFIRWNQLEAIY